MLILSQIKHIFYHSIEFIDLSAYISVYIPDSRSWDKMRKTQTTVPWVRQDEQEQQ
jgi:hypothetical protein